MAQPPLLCQGVSRAVLLASSMTERKSAARKQRTYRPTSLRGEFLLQKPAQMSKLQTPGSRPGLRSYGAPRQPVVIDRRDACLPRSGARPNCSLIRLRDGPEALVNEPLQALPFVSFGRIDVAFGIGRDAVYGVELAGLAPAVAKACQDFQRSAIDDVHLLIGAVGKIEILLLRIFRESDIPH